MQLCWSWTGRAKDPQDCSCTWAVRDICQDSSKAILWTEKGLRCCYYQQPSNTIFPLSSFSVLLMDSATEPFLSKRTSHPSCFPLYFFLSSNCRVQLPGLLIEMLVRSFSEFLNRGEHYSLFDGLYFYYLCDSYLLSVNGTAGTR